VLVVRVGERRVERSVSWEGSWRQLASCVGLGRGRGFARGMAAGGGQGLRYFSACAWEVT